VSVHFRRGSAFSEEALRQSYESLTTGTILEGAPVEIDTVNLDFECRCGHKQVITSDDLIGHMFVCPRCGATKEIDEAHDLELVELVAEGADWMGFETTNRRECMQRSIATTKATMKNRE